MTLNLEHIPEIIKEAAKSTLGIFALMIIVIAALAYVFFRKSGDNVKVPVFMMLFLGIVAFGCSISQASSNTQKNEIKSINVDTSKLKNPTSSTASLKKDSSNTRKKKAYHLNETITIIFDSELEGADLFIDNVKTIPDRLTMNTMEVKLSNGDHDIFLKKNDHECKRHVHIPSEKKIKLICNQ